MDFFRWENDTGPREWQMRLQTKNSLSVSSTHCDKSRLSLLQTRTIKVKEVPLVYIDYPNESRQSIISSGFTEMRGEFVGEPMLLLLLPL